MSRNTVSFVAANIFDPEILSIKRVNTKSRGYAFIIFDLYTIFTRVAAHFGLILSESDDPLYYRILKFLIRWHQGSYKSTSL